MRLLVSGLCSRFVNQKILQTATPSASYSSIVSQRNLSFNIINYWTKGIHYCGRYRKIHCLSSVKHINTDNNLIHSKMKKTCGTVEGENLQPCGDGPEEKGVRRLSTGKNEKKNSKRGITENSDNNPKDEPSEGEKKSSVVETLLPLIKDADSGLIHTLPTLQRKRRRSSSKTKEGGEESKHRKKEISTPSYEELVGRAVELLTANKLIALPTDTIYGIACRAQSDDAVRAVYRCKRRDLKKPLAICVSNIDAIYKYAKVTAPRSLLDDLLPGPVTVIFERTSKLNPVLNPDHTRVGIRIADSSFITDVVKGLSADDSDEAIALTSANISTAQSPLCIEDFHSLWGQLDGVFDGGNLLSAAEGGQNKKEGGAEKAREGSTVVDLADADQGLYHIVRNGR
eukprot:Nk52_evm2s324 gene=Nk52_evmTU2s324